MVGNGTVPVTPPESEAIQISAISSSISRTWLINVAQAEAFSVAASASGFSDNFVSMTKVPPAGMALSNSQTG